MNQRNTHVWSEENPRSIRDSSFQHEFRCNVWVGLWYDRIIGPYFLPNLNGVNYRHFLNTFITEYLENVPLNSFMTTWFQLDGCPSHYSIVSREWLDDHFPNRWIGRGGPVAWPPRSPDLTPLDFFIWGYLKSIVYAVPIHSLNQLKDRIKEACQQVNRQQCLKATRSVRKRCQKCIEVLGRNFEQNIN